MIKLVQMMEAISCWFEMECLVSKKNKGLHRITEMFDVFFSGLVFSLILAFGICKGWVHIPTYLGDGYSFDNYSRKDGNTPEYNYILDCFIDEYGMPYSLLAEKAL